MAQKMVQMHHPELVAAAQKRHGKDYRAEKCTASATEQAFTEVWEPKGFVQGPAPAAKSKE